MLPKKPAAFKVSGLFFILLLTFSLTTLSQSAFAEHPRPFLTRNQSPFSLIYGLPLATSAQLLPSGKSRWISSFNISNTLNSQANKNDSLFIDIETIQLNLLYDYSFKTNWMLRLQLPFISHSGGILDSAIDSYHQALNLPEGQRPGYPRDLIGINYTQNNTPQLNIDSSQKSAGDLSIQLAWQAQQSESHAISYWLSLKLPSGDSEKLTGSGATDISAWTSMDYRISRSNWFYGQAGLLYMGDSKVLQSIQNNWAFFGNAGIKFQAWDRIALKAQLDLHSAFYDSDIEFLGEVIQITFGGSYAISQKHKLDFAIAEDIKNAASPDVNFNISWWIYL